MVETFQRKDLAFRREDFFSGGPVKIESPGEIRVEDGRVSRDVPEVFRLLYKFTNMLVQSYSVVDSERTQFLLSSNNTVKLYSFDRSVTVVALQLLLIDGKLPTKELPANTPPQYKQDGYPQFMWLLEHELKMSASVRKNRRIVIRVKGMDHEVLVSNYNDGFASQGEWMVMASLELVVLSSQLVGVGPAGVLRQGTSGPSVIPTASQELLYSLGQAGKPTTPDKAPYTTNAGVSGATKRPTDVAKVSPDLRMTS